MLHSFEDLTADGVAGVGFDDPGGAAQLLRELAGHDISDERFERLLPLLAEGLKATGDPDRALANFARWLEHVGSRSSYFWVLTNHPAALHALLSVFSVSQFFSELLARYPEHFEVVVNPLIRDRPRTLEDYLRAAALRTAVAKTHAAKCDALRRFKPPEILRIGACDILGITGTEEVTAEISNFAEACIRTALEIAGARGGFAVLALGKLGGRELNYASDIDLIYVHGDEVPQEHAIQLANAVTRALSESTGAGFLFRVDLRLRPEGRFGPVSRSISACRQYYESWAEPWERQALIKARQVAGDLAVGEQFAAIAEPFVYRRSVDESFIDAIRSGKRSIERKVQRRHETDSNVKEGAGGIRDIEFIAQMLQLIAGGSHPQLRTGSTLQALRQLSTSGLLTANDAAELSESYIFLRNIEHRLQIMDERPIRNLPLSDIAALDKFARKLGYPDSVTFLDDFRKHTRRTRERLERLFYRYAMPAQDGRAERADMVMADWVRDPGDKDRRSSIVASLADLGFAEPEAAVRTIENAVSGSEYGDPHPEIKERMVSLAPNLLDACRLSGYPDDALKGLDLLASAVPSASALFLSLMENRIFLNRLARLAGGAPAIWRTLIEHPELLDRLAGEVELATPSSVRPPNAAVATAAQVASFLRREQLRTAATDLWGLASGTEVMAQITTSAEAALIEALDAALQEQGYCGLADKSAPIPALIGLGKLGGRELSYPSDWDVLWIAPGDGPDAARETRQIAENTMEFLNARVRAKGVKVDVDARLRPEGRFGTLARTLSDYAGYFATSAQPWERQVLIKARLIGGDLELGRRFLRAASAIVYDSPPGEEALAEIRRMKVRIERERAKSVGDIKLGPGGLSDIEWTTQMLQWRFGQRWAKARTPNTLAALKALRDAAVIRQDDWEILSDAYLDLYSLRNHAWLRSEHGGDVPEKLSDELSAMRKGVRAVFERLFLAME